MSQCKYHAADFTYMVGTNNQQDVVHTLLLCILTLLGLRTIWQILGTEVAN
jgi:hypothetical protein